MNEPDRNAIGSTNRFASPLAPSLVLATAPQNNPMAMKVRVPATTKGIAIHQLPSSCRSKRTTDGTRKITS